MRDEILSALAAVEKEEDCSILFAVESGSRAWGFESNNSDWDVRFVYVRRHDEYLSLTEPRDVIERSLPDDLDVVGWDVKKALKLIYKSNPSIMEWLTSTETYREDPVLAPQLRELAASYVRKGPAMHHYWSMAKTNFERNLQEESVSLKKYLYVIRPLLACRWVLARDTWPAIRFDELVSEFLTEANVREEVEKLVEFKKSAPESFMSAPNPVLHAWIRAELVRLEPSVDMRSPELPWEPLNEWFRSVVG